MGLFLILAVIVLGSADDNSQSQDLDLSDKLSRVAREAENSNGKKKKDKKTKIIKRKGNREAENSNGKKKKDKKSKNIKRKINRAKRRRKANKGKGKNLRAKKRKPKKKGGEKKNGKNQNKIKRNKKKEGKKNRRKGKKRGGKKKQKSKKDKNDKDRRKKRKGRKNRRRNRSTSTVSAKCYSQTVFMMKIWKDVVSNFKKQNARMKAQNSTGGSKSGKKGLFAPTAFKLIDIGGGNKSNLSCGGTYGSDGAKQLGNLTKTLFDCEVSVNTSCNPANFPQPNTTFIEACETGTTSFETQV